LNGRKTVPAQCSEQPRVSFARIPHYRGFRDTFLRLVLRNSHMNLKLPPFSPRAFLHPLSSVSASVFSPSANSASVVWVRGGVPIICHLPQIVRSLGENAQVSMRLFFPKDLIIEGTYESLPPHILIIHTDHPHCDTPTRPNQ